MCAHCEREMQHVGFHAHDVGNYRRYMAKQLSLNVRIIALSVSLSNARDFAQWLGCTSYNFPPTARPVKLDVKLMVSGGC